MNPNAHAAPADTAPAAATPAPYRRALTVEEFAKVWGLGRNTVYAEIAAGRLRTITVGRRRLITSEQVEAWRLAKESESDPSARLRHNPTGRRGEQA
jgi:excisionase family DNA binding protein